ncbi:MAG: glycosyltransferase family 2 protein, partial [Candidatus Atribacteria bacterium]|nr:glycosyltransferase family 2 protein [Candidatus Atribacteria bacterium]
MNKKILLSFCLPTYNQSQDFKRTLLSITSQLNAENIEEVEIVIGDNSENRETEELVKKEFSLPYLRYYHHKENLGIDRNILFLLEKANGRYVWLMGDDEIKLGAVNYILNAIKTHPDLSLIWVNCEMVNQSGSVFPYRFVAKDLFFTNGSQVLEKIGIGLNFMSTIILRKEQITKLDRQELKRHLDSGLLNLCLPLSILSRGGVFLITSSPFVVAHPIPREQIKWDYFTTVGINFNKVLLTFKDNFDKESVKEIQKEIFN